MASVGHIAVAAAAARIATPNRARANWSSIALWSLAAVAADLDFITLAFGVPYGTPFSHRGATHSFAFAAVLTLAIALVARRQAHVARTTVTAAIVTASHPVLIRRAVAGCPRHSFTRDAPDTRCLSLRVYRAPLVFAASPAGPMAIAPADRGGTRGASGTTASVVALRACGIR
jgi:membrane-bound metal-dependent hydrolase YbcI (DUF457 family)